MNVKQGKAETHELIKTPASRRGPHLHAFSAWVYTTAQFIEGTLHYYQVSNLDAESMPVLAGQDDIHDPLPIFDRGVRQANPSVQEL